MTRQAAGLALALLFASASYSLAQTAVPDPAPLPSPAPNPGPPVVQKSAIVTLDQEQLFTATKFGRALQAQFDAQSNALLAENRKIDSQLESEERGLTDKRATMTAQDFRPLAEAFDTKANEMRSAQEAKSRNLAKQRDENRQAFFQTIAPLLGDYMVERGAVAILDKSAIVVSLGSIDITAEVVARIDDRLGDGPKAP